MKLVLKQNLILGVILLGSISTAMANYDPDWNLYCTRFVDKKEIQCAGHISINNLPRAECSVPIEFKEIQTGKLLSTELSTSETGSWGMGIFNAIGIGLLLDGPHVDGMKAAAKKRINVLVDTALRHPCKDE